MPYEDATERRDPGTRAEPSRGDRLSLLYQGILIGIVRLQAGVTPLGDASAFQRRMEKVLEEIEREAVKVGYRSQDIRDAHYAVIAFLDETIQRSSDPNRDQWVPLQAKLYAQAVAGEGVYERLKALLNRRDSMELVDLLEVYYLCFLLGYEGQYALGGRSDLDRIMDDLRDRIERIRGRQTVLSPQGAFPDVPSQPPPVSNAPDRKWKFLAIGFAALAVLSWIVLKWMLVSSAQEVRGLIAS